MKSTEHLIKHFLIVLCTVSRLRLISSPPLWQCSYQQRAQQDKTSGQSARKADKITQFRKRL